MKNVLRPHNSRVDYGRKNCVNSSEGLQECDRALGEFIKFGTIKGHNSASLVGKCEDSLCSLEGATAWLNSRWALAAAGRKHFLWRRGRIPLALRHSNDACHSLAEPAMPSTAYTCSSMFQTAVASSRYIKQASCLKAAQETQSDSCPRL